MTKRAKPQALPKMTIVGTYTDDGKRVECLLVRIDTPSGQTVHWIDDKTSVVLPKQPKYVNQLEAIDWFFDRFEDLSPEVHVE